MTTNTDNPDAIPDGTMIDARQSAAALEIQRGVARILYQHGFASLTEMPLPNGRRVDVIGINEAGEIWIVEIKSSLEDFRSDNKWPEYREFCDRLFFAVKPEFPLSILPEDTVVILADRYGGEITRPAPEMRLVGARRKSITLRFARAAALRLTIASNPALAGTIDLAK